MAEEVANYRESVAHRLESADILVAKVVGENALLRAEVESKTAELQLLRSKLEKHEAQIQILEVEVQTGHENVDIVKDLFEHLCGVRVHKSYEDDSGLWFDCSQGTEAALMDYKLGFVKSAESENSTQVIYVPLLKQRSYDELTVLRERLPGYMFDTISFPLGSLNQFYGKMTRSLHKD